MQSSPKSFSKLVGRMKREKNNADAETMSLVRAQHEQTLQSEQIRHKREMEALSRRKDAEAMVLTQAVNQTLTPAATSTALVSIDNMHPAAGGSGGVEIYGSPPNRLRRSPPTSNHNSGNSSSYAYRVSSSSSLKKSRGGGGTAETFGLQARDSSPTGFMSPVTYNRKFNQLMHDMEVQTQLKVDEALRDQRDRHADALERVVAEKEGP